MSITLRAGLVLAVTLTVSACGGSGGGGTSLPPGATSTPTPAPTATPATQSAPQSVVIPSGGGSVALPPLAGYTLSMTLPSGGSSGSMQAQSFTTLPSGSPALSSARHPLGFGGTVFFVEDLTVTAPFTYPSPPTFTFGMPAGFSGSTVEFQLAFLRAGTTVWQENALAGVYNAATNTVTYTAPLGGGGSASGGAYVLPTGTSTIAFYTLPAGTATPPSGMPTPGASPTPAPGIVTEFSAGISGSSNPFGIAAGPDGNIWFTEFAGDRIGRINPTTFAITEFSTGMSVGAGPEGITAGPDGNLWFTE